ncbi:hypothetical protein ACA910_005523 [Epithemia clementina (nom. ined.)]
MATEPGERLYWDLTGPFHESLTKKKYLAMMVDQRTHQIWHQYLQARSAGCRAFKIMLNKVENLGVKVKYIQLDGAGENKAIMAECERRRITVKLTSPYTPQYNGVVERAFPTIEGKATAVLSAAGLSDDQRDKLWAHATDDAILTENLLPKQGYANCYEPFGEAPPVKPSSLFPFGLRGEMTIPTKQPNFANKSETVIQVGYARCSSHDTNLVMKICNNEVVRSRNIKWYRKWWWQADDNKISTLPTSNPNEMGKDQPLDPNAHVIPPEDDNNAIELSINCWKNIPKIEGMFNIVPDQPDNVQNDNNDNDDDDDDNGPPPLIPRAADDPINLPALQEGNDQSGRESQNLNQNNAAQANNQETTKENMHSILKTPTNKRLQSEMKRLAVSFNPNTNAVLENPEPFLRPMTTRNSPVTPERMMDREEAPNIVEQDERDHQQATVMNVSVNSDPGDPSNLKEARNSNKAKEWKEGLFSEYDNFMKRNAWKIVFRLRNARVLKTKNVFKTKPHAITKEI